jgi:glycosidase
MKKILFPLLFILIYSACRSGNKQNTPSPTSTDTVLAFNHPQWILQGNVYEVNVRQYTPEGTFAAFEKHLDRLQKMGVQTVWFMPINPISKVDRKGSLGSYYAVSDYTAINPEYGNLDDFKKLVKEIHDKKMKVIIDWVPNHTGGDNRWLTEHPDFFVKDSSGKAAIAVDWADTRQLDYNNQVMQDSMIAAMKYWITNTDIDGFRCDVAWNVPASFWRKCIPQLRAMKEIFMLAEGDKTYLPISGFDAVYPWTMFNVMKQVAKGERPATSLDSIHAQNDTLYPDNTIQLYFTSNHDENSWNSSDFGTFPGAVHAPFAVFTQTMADAVPLVYSGQEEPVLRAIRFFDKDTMGFSKYKRSDFYKRLLTLRTNNPALASDASFKKVSVGDDKAVYAFVREKEGKKVFVILNLSNKEQTITVKDDDLHGKPYNLFMATNEPLTGNSWKIEPWGYVVYDYTK